MSNSIDNSGEVSILLIKIIAAQNDVALSSHILRGLYFLAVIFAVSINVAKFIAKFHRY